MNIALVDDEALHLELLRTALTSALAKLGMEADQIHCFSDTASFLASFTQDKYDMILLDIYIDTATGIDVARKIRAVDETVALAFCTSSNEYAAQSYEVDAKYYLQKPVTEEKVAAMLKRFSLASIRRNRNIRLPDGFRVPLRHILYTEYLNHSVRFHLRGQVPHTVRANQSEIETLLLHHKDFCVVNKGCIVNFAWVKSIETNAFAMQNGETVPIARRRFKEIEAAYTKYLFDKMEEEVSD